MIVKTEKKDSRIDEKEKDKTEKYSTSLEDSFTWNGYNIEKGS